VYIDENGAADAELKVTVEDEEYTADVTFDLDQDGTNDSAVVETVVISRSPTRTVMVTQI
jgi:hypothetical protein